MENKSIWKKIQEKFQKDQEELQEEEVKESTKIVQLLRYLESKEEITLLKGMTEDEIQRIETELNIKFPIEMREVYKEVNPVGGGYVCWKDMSLEELDEVRSYMLSIKQYFLKYYEDIYWPDDYVEMGLDKNKPEFEKRLMAAPNLIPIRGSRCMVSGIDNGPYISVVGTDIIYYGATIFQGLSSDFPSPQKHYGSVYYKEIQPKIPFWSEMIEI